MLKTVAMAATLIAATVTSARAEMTLSFQWGDIPRCTSGRPNTVANPEFVIKGVPAGTEKIVFKLTDLNVPNFRHGGATLKMSASGTVPSGVFKYKSPCPPSGTHTYEWKAVAMAGRDRLATATARRKYPE